MKKNNVIIINPSNTNIMKAICNAIITNLVNIIIFGNKEKIKLLCDRFNININILRIIECKNEKEIIFKLEKFKHQIPIDGIIIDDVKDMKIKEQLKCYYLCHIIDFGVFKKSLFIINQNQKNKINNILLEIINLINNLNIKDLSIGIVSHNKEKAIATRKELKLFLNIDEIEIIDLDTVKRGLYNIIIFETKQLKQSFINEINELVLPRIIEINKASNTIVLDAKGKKFKNIFFQLLFLSKTNNLNNEIYTQTI